MSKLSSDPASFDVYSKEHRKAEAGEEEMSGANKTDKFVALGFAAERIEPGQRCEYLPSTGLVRKKRDYETTVTIKPDGSLIEHKRPERFKDD